MWDAGVQSLPCPRTQPCSRTLHLPCPCNQAPLPLPLPCPPHRARHNVAQSDGDEVGSKELLEGHRRACSAAKGGQRGAAEVEGRTWPAGGLSRCSATCKLAARVPCHAVPQRHSAAEARQFETVEPHSPTKMPRGTKKRLAMQCSRLQRVERAQAVTTGRGTARPALAGSASLLGEPTHVQHCPKPPGWPPQRLTDAAAHPMHTKAETGPRQAMNLPPKLLAPRHCHTARHTNQLAQMALRKVCGAGGAAV